MVSVSAAVGLTFVVSLCLRASGCSSCHRAACVAAVDASAVVLQVRIRGVAVGSVLNVRPSLDKVDVLVEVSRGLGTHTHTPSPHPHTTRKQTPRLMGNYIHHLRWNRGTKEYSILLQLCLLHPCPCSDVGGKQTAALIPILLGRKNDFPMLLGRKDDFPLFQHDTCPPTHFMLLLMPTACR